MCLSPRFDKNQPYNKSNIRWKIVSVVDGKYYAPFREYAYKKSGLNTAEVEDYITDGDTGFHVFVTRADARKNLHVAKKYWLNSLSPKRKVMVKKIRVSNFLVSGTWAYHASDFPRTETWRNFKFVKE